MSSLKSTPETAWLRAASAVSMATVLAATVGCAKKPAPAPAPAPVAAPAPAPAPKKKPEPTRQIPDGYASSRVYLPNANFETSILMLEVVGPTTLQKGATFDYTVYARNLSEATPLQNVVVYQEVPGELKVVSTEPAAAASTHKSLDGGTVVAYAIGELAPGQEVAVAGRAATEKLGGIESCLTAEYELWTCWNATVVEPALKITKAVTPTSHLVCDPITYTLVVTNDGTGVAKNVNVVDNLPAGVTTADGASTFQQALGDLAPGQSVNLTINAKANAAGSYTNDATATAEGIEVTSNEVTTTACKPSIEVSIDGATINYIGVPYTYTTTVTNTGDCEVRDLVLTNVIEGCTVAITGASDAGLTSTTGATWNLGTLGAGQSKTVTLDLSGPNPCTVTAKANASGYCAEAADDVAQTELVGVPAVLLEVVDSPDPVRLGTETVYTITVTNQGTATDTNVAITAELEKFDYVSSTGPTTASVSGSTITFAPLATLPVGASETWTVRAKSTATGDTRFSVRMDTDQLEDSRPVEETEATRVFEESELLRQRTK